MGDILKESNPNCGIGIRYYLLSNLILMCSFGKPSYATLQKPGKELYYYTENVTQAHPSILYI